MSGYTPYGLDSFTSSLKNKSNSNLPLLDQQKTATWLLQLNLQIWLDIKLDTVRSYL